MSPQSTPDPPDGAVWIGGRAFGTCLVCGALVEYGQFQRHYQAIPGHVNP